MFEKAFILCAALLAWFCLRAEKRQRIAVVLAWLIPGGGHFYLGQKRRGIFLGSMVILVFLVGMVLADFRNIAPLTRHPIWGIAHLFGGLMTAIATAATSNLMIVRDSSYYHVGCLYSGIGALLNVLVAIDAYDIASKKSEENSATTQEEVA